jgi:hypothetical protein
VAGCGDEDQPGRDLGLSFAVELDELHRVEADPLRDRVFGLEGGPELGRLHVRGPTCEQGIAAAVVEVQVRVRDGGDVVGRQAVHRQGVRERCDARPVVLLDLGMPGPDSRVEEQDASVVLDRESQHGAGPAGLGVAVGKRDVGEVQRDDPGFRHTPRIRRSEEAPGFGGGLGGRRRQ